MYDYRMTDTSLPRLRLANQLISNPVFDCPEDVVRWMGMVQAQDYLGALWAVGLRLPVAAELSIEQALAERKIVRTWPARGTLHFVAAADVRWLLELLASRALTKVTGRQRQLGLDEITFSRSRDLVARSLQGGKSLTRPALIEALEAGQISTDGQRGIHIVARLAQEGLICFGPREGKQQTFVLMDEWVPPAKQLTREEALAELARRYFTSHGQASLKDFAWWSGLTLTDVRKAVEFATPDLVQAEIDGQSYWQARTVSLIPADPPFAYLLPPFDEYLVGYTDRSAVIEPQFLMMVNAGGGLLNPTIVVDGQVLGTWKRTLKAKSVVVSPQWFTAPTTAQKDALSFAAQRYGSFLNLPVILP